MEPQLKVLKYVKTQGAGKHRKQTNRIYIYKYIFFSKNKEAGKKYFQKPTNDTENSLNQHGNHNEPRWE